MIRMQAAQTFWRAVFFQIVNQKRTKAEFFQGFKTHDRSARAVFSPAPFHIMIFKQQTCMRIPQKKRHASQIVRSEPHLLIPGAAVAALTAVKPERVLNHLKSGHGYPC